MASNIAEVFILPAVHVNNFTLMLGEQFCSTLSSTKTLRSEYFTVVLNSCPPTLGLKPVSVLLHREVENTDGDEENN